jgi:hypothetical protein
MRINARLDDSSSQKLDHLQRMTGWGISEIVRKAIDAYYHHVRKADARSAELLAQSGLVGCSEGPPDLSENYKNELTRELASKHDNR